MKSLLEYIKSQPESIVRGWFSDSDYIRSSPAQKAYDLMKDTENYGLLAFQALPVEIQAYILTNYYSIYLRPKTPIQ